MKNKFLLFLLLSIFLCAWAVQLHAASGFYISSGRLFDANGSEFIIRGISHAHCWFPNNTYAIADIKSVSANAVRLVCSNGVRWPQTSSSDLSNLISICKSNRIIAIPEVHDTTGYGEEGAACTLAQAVSYWRNVQSVLNGQEAYVLINIGNEPYGNNNYTNWINDTRNAIQSMRSAGFNHTIVVDAPNWGQDWSFTMRDNAQQIFNADPDGNTLLSVHMYGVYDTAAEVQNYISTIKGQGLPLMIGEFGHNHSDGNPDEDAIMSNAQSYGIGYIAWSWCGNSGGVEYLDMVNNWNVNSLTSWGNRVVSGTNGLQQTSRECTIFSGSNITPDPTFPPTPVPTPTPTPTVEPTPAPSTGPGNGDGLLGEYFSGTNLSNLVYTTVDPVLDISWGGGSPDSSVPQDQFSARWTGKIEAPIGETYTIYTQSDDGIRVWINNQQVIDDWNDHAAGPEYEASGTITMSMGQQYDIRVEYYENGGDAAIHLWWENPWLARQIIPRSQLYSGGSPTTPPGILGDVNEDEFIDIVDALLIAQEYVGLNPQNFNPANADTNCDGFVDIVDALLVAQYYVDLIQGFCL